MRRFTSYIDLKAPTLAGPPLTNLGAGPPGCTTPRQLTIYIFLHNLNNFEHNQSKTVLILWGKFM